MAINPLVRSKAAFFSGVFLLCMSILMIQIVQTRILSVVSLYYMAFFSISMAMLGLTVGALIVYFKMDHVQSSNVCAYLSRITAAFALSVAVCFLLQLATPLSNLKWATFVVVWLKAILLLATPFVMAGIAVSLALTRSPYRVGITYGVDLLGAAVGCLVVLAVLTWMDSPSAMFLVAALVAASAWCFTLGESEPVPASSVWNWRILQRPAAIAVALAAVALTNSSVDRGLQPVSAKSGAIERIDQFEFVQWNSFSRVAARYSKLGAPFLWGASPTLPPGKSEERMLDIDGFAGTSMPRFTGAPGQIDHLRYDITNLAYYARSSGRAAIIGVGSGRDLLSAYLFGFRDITGVELNPVFVDFLTDPAKLRGYAGIADLPGIRLVVDDGRSWFARTQEKFDLIEMSMVDTFAATGAGAFSLSENGLYTVEGWRNFLAALQPDGLFTVSRWHSPTAPVEMGRVLSLAVGALMDLGIQKPREHIYVAGVGDLATIIVGRRPLAASELKSLNDAASKLRFDVLASPDGSATIGVFADLLSARNVADLNARGSRYNQDVSAPTDARPFFFNQVRIGSPSDVVAMVREWKTGSGGLTSGAGVVAVGNLIAIGTLLLVIALSAAVVFFAVLLPARFSIRSVDWRLALTGSGYFLLIGLGFMFVEIGLIQRISVFLGHPVYALSIGLFSIILSTGLGSLLSERLTLSRGTHLIAWLGPLTVYLLVLPEWLPALTHSLEARGLAVRALASVTAIFPAGLLMGFGFPIGMRLVSAIDPRPTPWFWGINGAAGVLAAGLAVACSIAFSIDVTIRIGAACYILLFPVALILVRKELEAAGAGAKNLRALRT